MADFQLKTPIAFIIFNRPESTARVFEIIRQAKPSQLFVIADGPRPDNPSDLEKSAATRAIVDKIDWQCEVLKNYSDVNMGCQYRVSSGLDWVFSHVEEAIILEDDCLPHPTFFQYCEELLEYYRDDRRVMSIAGANFQAGRQRTDYSYYFSICHDCWGWATWKRAWQYFDFDMKLWSKIKNEDIFKEKLINIRAFQYWNNELQLTYSGHINSWFYRWVFSCWIQSGLSIIPEVNLVSNIGFGKNATHTVLTTPYSNMPTSAISFPLKHPPFLLQNIEADKFTQKNRFKLPKFTHAKIKLKIIIKTFLQPKLKFFISEK